MIELAIEGGPLDGSRFTLTEGGVLGRGQMADLRVDDATVSRRHAEVRKAGAGWEVVDLGSANGTRVNGISVGTGAPLSNGDVIELGQVAIRVALARPVSVTPTGDSAMAPTVGSAFFQEVLARLKLFCELGTLSSAKLAPEARYQQALLCVLRAFPKLDRVLLLMLNATGDAFTLKGVATRISHTLNTQALAPIAREALRQSDGLLAFNGSDRERVAKRLGLLPFQGALAVLPVRASGAALGVIYMDSEKDEDALRSGDRESLTAVANLLGSMLAAERATKQQSAIENQDLALARSIQQRFLPQSPPNFNGYSIVDSYTAARVIGGDHFDFLTLVDGRTAIVVADVSGKAVSGALYMARLGAVLRQAASRARRAPELLTDLNTVLYPELEAGMFITMLIGVLDPRSGALELASAGHSGPLIRHANGRIERVEVPAGPALGAMSQPAFEAEKIALVPGDLMLFYTDGLDEAHDAKGDLFGHDRIKTSMSMATGAAATLRQILDDLGRFVGSEPPHDDLTLVLVERLN